MLLLALQFGLHIIFGDISTACLHADMEKEYYAWPPKEYYPDRNIVWRLRKALAGLKDAPKALQYYFAELLQKLGGRRFKSDSNLYYFDVFNSYILVYVDDLMVVGLHVGELFKLVAAHVLLRPTG